VWRPRGISTFFGKNSSPLLLIGSPVRFDTDSECHRENRDALCKEIPPKWVLAPKGAFLILHLNSSNSNAVTCTSRLYVFGV